jgi:hypothetical protein
MSGRPAQRHEIGIPRVVQFMGGSTPRHLVVLGICLVLAMLMSACGGEDDSGKPARVDKPPEAREAADGRRGAAGTEGSEGDSAPRDGDGDGEGEGGRGGGDRDGGRRRSRDKPKKVPLEPLPPKAQARVDHETALARRTITALVRGISDHDASVCTRLFDQHLIDPKERGTADARCRESVSGKHRSFKLVKFESFRVLILSHVRRTIVRFLVDADGTLVRHHYRLTRSRKGPYRIDATFPVKQPS